MFSPKAAHTEILDEPVGEAKGRISSTWRAWLESRTKTTSKDFADNKDKQRPHER
jgi:hypothetical protein